MATGILMPQTAPSVPVVPTPLLPSSNPGPSPSVSPNVFPTASPEVSPLAGAQTPDAVKPSGPQPSPSPSVSPSPVIVWVTDPYAHLADISEAQGKSLLHEFDKAQRTEMKALEHRQKLDLKELQNAQTLRLKKWEENEKELRHQFFAKNSSGPARRDYVQDFLKRREAFRQEMKKSVNARKAEHQARRDELRAEQKREGVEFKRIVNKLKQPPTELWP